MIRHNTEFDFDNNTFRYNGNTIQAFKNSIPITLEEFNNAYQLWQINAAFSALMGVNGDKYVGEIQVTQQLSQASYDIICENIKFNSKESIIRYFGLVHYYYLQGK